MTYIGIPRGHLEHLIKCGICSFKLVSLPYMHDSFIGNSSLISFRHNILSHQFHSTQWVNYTYKTSPYKEWKISFKLVLPLLAMQAWQLQCKIRHISLGIIFCLISFIVFNERTMLPIFKTSPYKEWNTSFKLVFLTLTIHG